MPYPPELELWIRALPNIISLMNNILYFIVISGIMTHFYPIFNNIALQLNDSPFIFNYLYDLQP